ncbi:MAG: HAD-IIA family hydrolase [Candidatus Dadabacteria bacterium]|nr:HAD-IIA family hydrolase [Candidatus Dadabacteria bacterium]NIT13707.1 HAD-IIA family hydrolase [Candidatus Dadabacteria bacterium]
MNLADLFDSFLIDLDGVVYVGDSPTYRAPQTVKKLYKAGKEIVFITNDPRRSSSQYSKKLAGIDIQCRPKNIVTSATALSLHIQNKYDINSKTAFVIGSDNLKKEIKQTGLKLISKNSKLNSDFVVVGGNNKVDYNDLKKATVCIRNGAKFFATNNDPYYPTSEGLVPATGALVAAIETASASKATVVGKPKRIMFSIAKDLLINQKRIAVIGDRLDTDIAGGKKAGFSTILSLTGSTGMHELKSSKIKPDYVIENLSYLYRDAKLSKYH